VTASRRLTVYVVVVAGIAATSAIVHTRHGITVTGDATSYVSVAENLLDGNGLRKFHGDWHTPHPPGFAMVLAGLELLGGSARGGAVRWLNIVLYWGGVVLAGLWLKTICRHWLPVVAATTAMACSFGWLTVSSGYYSEPLFLLLALASLMLVSRLLRAAATERATATDPQLILVALAAGALAGASTVTRWMGFTVIASGALAVLLAPRRQRQLNARVKLAAVYGSVASLPVIVVLGLNAAYGPNLVGPRTARPGASLLDTVESVIRVSLRPEYVAAWLMLLAALLVAVVVRSERGLSWLRCEHTLPFAVFAAIYVIVLVISTRQGGNSPIPQSSGRLLLPAGLAVVLVSSELLDKALSQASLRELAGRLRRGVLLITAAAMAVAMLSSLRAYVPPPMAILLDRYWTPGLTTPEIHDADLFDYLEQHPIEGQLYSNRPNAVFWVAGHLPVGGIPEAEGAECIEWMNDTRPEHVYWFAALDPYEATPRCDLPAVESELLHHRAVHRSEDGVVYRLSHSGNRSDPINHGDPIGSGLRR